MGRNQLLYRALRQVLVGASLSDPHTSVTSLHTCVCMLAWTDHLPKILNERVFLILRRSSSWLLPECSVSYLELRRLKLKHAWHLTPCLLQIINGRLPTGSTNFDHEGLSGCLNCTYRPQKFSSCHDFSV